MSSYINLMATNITDENPKISGEELFTAIGTAVYDRYELPLAAGVMRGTVEDRASEILMGDPPHQRDPFALGTLLEVPPTVVEEAATIAEAPAAEAPATEAPPTVVEEAATEAPADKQDIVVTDNANPQNPPSIMTRPELFSILQNAGADSDPDIKNAGVDNLLMQSARENIDAGALKQDIEALMPAVEGDSQMEGLLLAYLGAQIAAGSSENWVENVANGVSSALPTFINYKNKQTESKRARETSIARMAIEQKFALEAEQRLEEKVIRTETREEAKNRRMKIFEQEIEKEVYALPFDHTIDIRSLNPDSAQEGKVTIPQFTPFPLNKDQISFFTERGIPLIRQQDIPEMVRAASTAGGKIGGMSREDWNGTAENKPFTIFKQFTAGVGYTGSHFVPKPFAQGLAAATGDPRWLQTSIQDDQLEGVYKAYEALTTDHLELFGDLDELAGYTDEKDFSGIGKLRGSISNMLRGAGADSLARWMLGDPDKEVPTYTKFTAKARLILAKIAPILLGESGKTISDADRVRVAMALGLNIEMVRTEEGTVWRLATETPFKNVLTSRYAVRNAIYEVKRALTRNLNEISTEYDGFLRTHNRVVKYGGANQDTAEIYERGGEEGPQYMGTGWGDPEEFDLDLMGT